MPKAKTIERDPLGELVKEYLSEYESPCPDALYKHNLRQRLAEMVWGRHLELPTRVPPPPPRPQNIEITEGDPTVRTKGGHR